MRAVAGAFSRRALRRTVLIALVVGTVLSVVDQGGVVARGSLSIGTWLRIAANYLTPFCVSTAGYLSTTQRQETPDVQRVTSG